MREDGHTQYEMTVGSLDDPNIALPVKAVGVESKLHRFDTVVNLRSLRTDEDHTPDELAKGTSLHHPDHDARSDEPYADNATGSSPWRLVTRQDFDRIVAMNERLNTEDPSETMPFDGMMMRRTLSEITLNPIGGAAATLELEGKLCGYALLISFWSKEFGGEICPIDELYVER
jgi:hypothetical protein